jgi:quercetin dioxygenase-like cupin family protein
MSIDTIGTIDALEAAEPYPGIRRRELHGEGASIYWYDFEPGAAFPLHRHHQEQITVVEQGMVTMRTGPSDAHQLGADSWTVTDRHVEHGITAGPEGARIMIVLTPRRGTDETVEVLA